MPWYVYLANFGAGMFLINCVPHLVHGVSGAPFQTPFAKPSGVGESPAVVNVLWGMFNLAVGQGLLIRFPPPNLAGWIVLFLGATLLGVMTAQHFGKVRAGKP